MVQARVLRKRRPLVSGRVRMLWSERVVTIVVWSLFIESLYINRLWRQIEVVADYFDHYKGDGD